MISSRMMLVLASIASFVMGGCAPEDGGKKVKSVSFYVNNKTEMSIQNVFVSPSGDDDWGNDKLILPIY